MRVLRIIERWGAGVETQKNVRGETGIFESKVREGEECVGWALLLIGRRGGGLGSRPKKMYGERLGDGVEYHLMSPTPRR